MLVEMNFFNVLQPNLLFIAIGISSEGPVVNRSIKPTPEASKSAEHVPLCLKRTASPPEVSLKKKARLENVTLESGERDETTKKAEEVKQNVEETKDSDNEKSLLESDASTSKPEEFVQPVPTIETKPSIAADGMQQAAAVNIDNSNLQSMITAALQPMAGFAKQAMEGLKESQATNRRLQKLVEDMVQKRKEK